MKSVASSTVCVRRRWMMWDCTAHWNCSSTASPCPHCRRPIQLPATRPTLSAALEVAVYRIVQEALTNISKHAHAHSATVTLEAEDDRLILTICDDGVGLPSQPEMGMGLHSMRERAEELGGTLTVRPNTPTGSCIFAQFPLEPGESDGSDSYPDL